MAAAAARMMMMVLICVAASRGVVDGQNSTIAPSTTTTPAASSNDRLPPMITINPSSITFSGTSVQLPCSATGFPTPTYTWKKNGVTLSLPTDNIKPQSAGNILINPASSSDNGYYQCLASNQWGTAVSTVAYIQAASLGTFPSLSTAYSMTDQPGASVTIPCNSAPASIPAAQFSWSIQSITSTTITPVNPSSRIQINTAGGLVFANVVSSDATPINTVYRCSAYNSVMGTTVAGSNTTLTVSGSQVNSAPVWSFYSNAMSVVLGQTFTINCFFTGNPTPGVSWSVQGGSLPTGRYSIDGSGTQLTISDAQLTDAVAYQCMGSNIYGNQTVTINVKVNIAPNFTDATNGPANVNATNGDTVSFNCSFTANPTGQMSWYQNGQPLQAGSLPSTKYTLSPDQTVLTVTNVCKQCSDGSSDLTVIQCNVSNGFGYAYGQAYLNVLLPTTILSVTNNQTIGAGDPIDLNCQASSDPTTGINITWYFNSQQLQSTTYVPSSASVSSTYVITGAQPGNQGAYTCLATNGYSYATADIGLLVTPAMVQSAADYWYIFMIIGLLILFVIIAIIAFYCHWKNVGESYPVDNVEKKNGNDPVKDLQQSGFQDYQRPEGTTTATTGAAAYGATDQQYETNPDGVSVDFSQLDGQYGGGAPQYQANSALAAALAGKAALTDDDTFTTTGPKQIQLVGAGAPRYYYPEQPPASDGDLDAAFDDGSVAGTEQHPAQFQQQQQQSPAYVGRAYAGSMPALADETMSTTWQLSAEEQRRRRLFGSVPTVLDDIARAGGGGGRFGVYAGAAVAGDDYHGDNNDGWMDDVPVRDESTRSPLPQPAAGYYDDMTMRRPGPVPPQPPPRRYTDVDGDVDRRQMASPTRFVQVRTPLPRDDVFPVMYNDGAAGYPVGHDVIMDYADDDDGYDIDYNRIGGMMKQHPQPHPAIRVAGINSPHNVSMPHTASESSV